MSSLSFLQVYLAINVLLAISYLAFATLEKLSNPFKLKVSSRQLVRLAQLLLSLSILIPPALRLIPSEQMPVVEFRAFHPAPEGDDAPSRTKASAAPKLQAPPEIKAPQSLSQGFFAKSFSANTSSFILCTLAIGIALMLIRTASNLLRLRATILSGTIIRTISSVKISVSDEISVPFSAWMGRTSWVVLPTSILQNRNDFWLALKHELQHHRCGDTRWAFLIEPVACAFFLNPAIYLWKQKLNELQEFSCDEALVGQHRVSRHDYGSCLVRVAEAAFEGRQIRTGTACMAAIFKNPKHAKSFLRRRIEMFESHNSPNAHQWAAALLGTLATICTVSIAFGAEQAMRKDQQAPNPGTVAVDPTIQDIADKAVRDAVKAQNAKSGFAIVADPNSGKILAVAEVDTTGKLKKNWPLNQVLEPASLAKTLVAAQAIESGVTTPQEKHSCENGKYQYKNRIYHDWKKVGWNQLTTEETIAVSSDICTMKIAEKVGTEGLYKMLINFGFGPEGTAKTFPSARPGILPPQDQPQWPEMLPAISAGYGFKTTPIELLQAYGAIANGGNLLMPKQANETPNPQIVRRVLSRESAEQTKEILRQVVLKGTGKNHASSNLYSTAGKTATSYIPDLTQWRLVEAKKQGNFAGFIGFAPVKNPQIEVYVGILDPQDGDQSGAHGSAHAAPVFKRIIEETLQHMHIAPDQT